MEDHTALPLNTSRSAYSERRAVFISILPRNAFLVLFALCLVGEVMVALSVPGHIEESSETISYLRQLFLSVPDVKSLSATSMFPDATAFAYGLAIWCAPIVALLFSFTALNPKVLGNATERASSVTRVVWTLGALSIIAAPVLFEFADHGPALSRYVLESVAVSRLALAIYASSLLVSFGLAWGLVLFELSNVIRGATK